MVTKQKIVKGGFYLALVSIISQMLSIGVNIVLARLLAPEDFGLVAIATAYIGFITIFTTIGFGSSIIHNQTATNQQISTLYWLNWILAVGSFVLINISSNYASSFYNEPQLVNIVFLSSINVLFSPIYTIQSKLLERAMQFKKLSMINIISTASGAMMGIATAFFRLGVYALVVQLLVTTLVRMFLILIAKSWRPEFKLDLKGTKDMIWYSIKYKAADAVLYIERNIDFLILGKIYNSAILGYYSFSYNIMYTPVKRVSYIFNDVLFPSFSGIQNDKNKMVSGYFQSMQLIAIVSFPIMALLAFNADWLIPKIFGTKWVEAIPVLKVLCFAGAVQSISQVGSVIFPSIGKPEVSLYLSVAKAILTTIAIIVGSFFGIMHVAYFLFIAKTLSFLLTLIFIYNLIPFQFLSVTKYLVGPVVSIVILALLNFFFNSMHFTSLGIIKLCSMSLMALIIGISFHFSVLKNIIKIVLN